MITRIQLPLLLTVTLAFSQVLLAEAPNAPSIEDHGAWIVIKSYDAQSWQKPIARKTPTVRVLRKDTVLAVIASFDRSQEDKIQSDGDPATAPTIVTITTSALDGTPENKNATTENTRHVVRGMTWTQAEKVVAQILEALKSSDGAKAEE